MHNRFLLPALVLALAGCTAPPDAGPPAPAISDTQRHGVHSARLRDIMARMNALVADNTYTPLVLEALRSEYMDDLIDAAAEVVETAYTLDEQDFSHALTDDQKVVFAALADQLYADAVNVGHRARMADFNELEVAYKRLEKTCVSCHFLLRDLPLPGR